MSCTAEGQPGNPAKTSEATATMAIVKPMIGHRTIKPPGTWAETDDGGGGQLRPDFEESPPLGVSSDLYGRSSRPNGDDKLVSGVMNHPDVGLALSKWLDGVVDPDDIWPAPAAVSSPLDLRHPVVCPGGWAHSLQAGVDPLRRAPTPLLARWPRVGSWSASVLDCCGSGSGALPRPTSCSAGFPWGGRVPAARFLASMSWRCRRRFRGRGVRADLPR